MGIWTTIGLLVLLFASPLIPDDSIVYVAQLVLLLLLCGNFVMFWNNFRWGDRDGN